MRATRLRYEMRKRQSTSSFAIASPLIISCFQVPSFRPWQVAGGAPTEQRLGDRPWLMGKGFLLSIFHPLPVLSIEPKPFPWSVPVPIFSDRTSSAVLIGVAPTSWIRGLER